MNSTTPKRLTLLVCAMVSTHAGAFAQTTPIQVPGFLKFEVYTNIPGVTVNDLVFSPAYPASPSRVFYMPSFDTRTVYPDDSHDNFGGRLSGFLTPTETDDYSFFLRSDEASQLYLSTNADPANLELIAEETTCCGPFEEPGAPETSFNRTLQGGQRYAIQVLYKEGVGGDFCQVAWRKGTDITPAAQLTPIPSAFLSTLIAPRGSIAITSQPANATAGQNEYITLDVGFTASHAPAVVQWQRNGTNIPGLTGSPARLGPLNGTEGGTYRAVISIPGAVTNSAQATVTVPPDVTPPTIKSVVGNDSFNALTVEFSEAVRADGAGDDFNYMLSGLSFSGVTVLSPTSVRLVTSTQTPGATYTLTIQNIVDMANLTSTPGTSRSFTALTRVGGGAKFEAWLGIAGSAVADLVANPRYPASPDVNAYITRLTSRLVFADASSMNDYGGRMAGWIVAPETAQYHFFIRSDDSSQLSFSLDENPTNATVIASESACCGPFEEPGAPETSAPISLTAGNRYFIEALWKEGAGGDYCDVAWRKVGDPTLAINLPFIPNTVLETYAPTGTFIAPTVTFSNPASGATFDATDAVTLTAAATASSKSIVKVEFLEQGRVVGTVSNSPYSITFYELREDNHTYIARATDSAGLFTDSTPLTISVGAQVATVKLAAIDTITLWHYDRSGSDLMTDWRQPGYNDSAWGSGPALIADEGTTTVEPIRTRISRFNDMGQYVRTFYYRTHFNFDAAVSPAVKLKLRHVVDDGVVFYLNGMEIHRFGIAAGVAVDYLTDAAGHENVYEGPYDIPIDNLLPGDNVLAAEVHQSGGSSSDMVFGAELIATVPVVRPTMAIARNGVSLTISWTPAGGALESAPAVNGPWTAVGNATNPHLTTASQNALFYRVSR